MSYGSRKQKILNPNQSYTFRSYFEMRFPITDILWELGVSFNKKHINFPQASTNASSNLSSLRKRLEEAIVRVNLTYPMATLTLVIHNHQSDN